MFTNLKTIRKTCFFILAWSILHHAPALYTKENMKPIVIQTQKELSQAIASTHPVLVEFYKINCPYCKEIEPLIESTAQELARFSKPIKVYVLKLTKENKDIYKKKYGFKAFPRCALFQQGSMKALLDITSEELTKEKLLHFVKGFVLR